MNVNKIADQILKDWFGPTGKCWCEKKKKFIDPTKCVLNDCPECTPLGQHENRLFRHIPENDYVSYGT